MTKDEIIAYCESFGIGYNDEGDDILRFSTSTFNDENRIGFMLMDGDSQITVIKYIRLTIERRLKLEEENISEG